MKKWKYHKGCELDFGSNNNSVLMVKSGSSGLLYGLSRLYSERIKAMELAGDEIIAHRQLISDDEQDLNDCIGSTEALIAERGARYGKFKDGAEIMQELKGVMRSVDGWSNLSPSQKEALDMIQHKIGRILNGDPNYDDNWKDVAGYATLIVNELNGEVK